MNRLYKVQKRLLRVIDAYEAKIPNEQRDSSCDWERIHMASCGRMGHIFAERMGIDPELGSIAAAIHDYGRIITGKQKDHAEAGYLPVQAFLRESGLFTEEEIAALALSVKNHSRKSEIGTPLEEVAKNADVVDYYQFTGRFSRQEHAVRYRMMQEQGLI